MIPKKWICIHIHPLKTALVMPYSEKFDTLFIHIPRTSGSELEKFLQIRGRARVPDLGLLYGGYLHEKGQFSLQHLTCIEMLKFDFMSYEKFQKAFKFSFVRNPYHRCASLYFYWGGPEKWGSFLAFVKHLRGLKFDRYAFNGHEGMTFHLLPQYMYLYDADDRLLVDKVYHLESRLEGLRALSERTGFKAARSQNHRSHGSRLRRVCAGFYFEYLYRRPWVQKFIGFRRHRSMLQKQKEYDELYCDEARAIIADVYAKDFELFSYDQ